MGDNATAGAIIHALTVTIVAITGIDAALGTVIGSAHVAAVILTVAISLLDTPVQAIVFQPHAADSDGLIRRAGVTIGELIAGVGAREPVADWQRDGQRNALIVLRVAVGAIVARYSGYSYSPDRSSHF